MSEIIALIAVFIIVVGGILLLIEAFKVGIIWGLACLLISPVALVFIILHWDIAKKPFFIQLFGVGVLFLVASQN
ncbi:hypothetical protein [sulfur-oxidizing endosymbiont of Gigantopelta aegis]|uniref:hypothetical protein n=1 Tax=sulfur-oxidizing endosymbiont of Gigantopelta aegis TaxID=2794934 RepID=UPI0018DDD378|nr:hypothetical protein [sulfur-oxidizing endosymbiont of Gigantopelta aegis]